MKERVVVTGLGIVSSIGKNVDEFKENLFAGNSGIKEIKRFDTTGYRTSYAAEIQGLQFSQECSEYDRCLQLILETTKQAVTDGGIDFGSVDRRRVGVVIATSLGCVDELEKYIKTEISGAEEKKKCADLNLIPHCIPSSAVARKYKLSGPVISVDTACASGSNSISYAYDLVRSGRCDLVIAGGVDVLNTLSYSGFSGMMNLTKTVCRPFNLERTGMVLGEGSATVILESLSFAQRRKAHIYGEVFGYGLSNDAFHETKPDPEARGAVMAMASAIDSAGLSYNDVDYINSHGTGTKLNDLMEAKAIKEVFREHAPQLKISSIKAAIGHTLGAAGAIEFLATVLSTANDYVPPTLNWQEPMVGYEDFDFVPNRSKKHQVNVAMSNSFGFAGNCCVILLGKLTERK